MQHPYGMGRTLSRTLLLALFLLSGLAACDNDHDGPTGPPAPVPNVAGVWNGTFTSDAGTALVALSLEQSGRQVTGSVAVGGLVWALAGTIDSLGRLEWGTTGATCGSFDGRVLVDRSRTSMAGSAELNRFACPEGRRRRGDLALQKVR
jgi:hypothetical protein